jgi:hypothetical protein
MMPEYDQSSSEQAREPQKWLAKQLAYTANFYQEPNDNEREQRAAEARIAARLFSSYLNFSVVGHARYAYACALEHFPLPEILNPPDEAAVVIALADCLSRWHEAVEQMAHPTKEEAAAVSKELMILALSLLYPGWVREVPDLPQPASAADKEDEALLAAIGYPGERLTLALKENAIITTSATLQDLTRRLATTVRQAAAEELAEALQNLSHPRRLTERRARVLHDQIAEEIQQDDLLRRYFSLCCRIAIDRIGESEYQIHLYFHAYNRDYGEMWVHDEKHWQTEAAKIRQEVKEEEW